LNAPITSPPETPRRSQIRRTSATPSIGDERSDIESDIETPRKIDQLGKIELKEKYLKQEQTLKRFRQKFSEVKNSHVIQATYISKISVVRDPKEFY